ncbi:MAG: response regulator transcription factor [Symploca sp. SIO2E6]|nr:response regulator transcription factor [Symploca sp. SIO2E6]
MLFGQRPLIRVLVVDDHELTRFSLKLALNCHQQIKLVGLASNGQEAIEMAEYHRPDVIILDLQMPVMDGLTASNLIKAIDPKTQIIAYSSIDDWQVDVIHRTGRVDAFCKKDTPTQDLIKLVKKLGELKPDFWEETPQRLYPAI